MLVQVLSVSVLIVFSAVFSVISVVFVVVVLVFTVKFLLLCCVVLSVLVWMFTSICCPFSISVATGVGGGVVVPLVPFWCGGSSSTLLGMLSATGAVSVTGDSTSPLLDPLVSASPAPCPLVTTSGSGWLSFTGTSSVAVVFDSVAVTVAGSSAGLGFAASSTVEGAGAAFSVSPLACFSCSVADPFSAGFSSLDAGSLVAVAVL